YGHILLGARVLEAGPHGRLGIRSPCDGATVSVRGAMDESREDIPPGEAAGGDAAPPPRRRRHSVLGIALSVVGVLLAVVIIAGFFIHLPYVIIAPGEATPLDQRVVTINGVPTYDHHGNVVFLTVQVSNHDPNVWRLVASWLDPDRDVVKRENAVGCLSDTE